jgi:inner membrane protein
MKMNGTAHMGIGAATGLVVSNIIHSDISTTLLLVGVGGIAGLMPDIDIDGKLSNKITISHKIFRTITCFTGFLLMLYSYLQGIANEKWIGIAIGIIIIILSSFITQRRMLTITGIAVTAGGISLAENWLELLGVFIIIASLVPHRSYTHSIVGVLFFAVIAFQFEYSLGIQGIFAACLGGYISHLLADLKILPFNKRGVKLFLPFSKHEF